MRAFFQRLFRNKKTQKHNKARPVIARPVIARPVIARPVIARPVIANSNYIAVTKKRSLTRKKSITPYARLHGLKTKTKSARKRSDSGSYNKLFERGTDTQLNNKVRIKT